MYFVESYRDPNSFLKLITASYWQTLQRLLITVELQLGTTYLTYVLLEKKDVACISTVRSTNAGMFNYGGIADFMLM